MNRNPRPGALAPVTLSRGGGLGWRFQGACNYADPSLFFGPDGETPDQQEEREGQAKTVCAACPVRWKCASWAVATNPKWGVWGGMGEAELAREHYNYLRRQRRYAA